MDKELTKLIALASEQITKIDKAKADIGACDVVTVLMLQDILNGWSQTVGYLRDSINYLSNSLYNHMDSSKHLPPCPGPSAMTSAIKSLGWDDDYKVQPRVVYASEGGGIVAFVD